MTLQTNKNEREVLKLAVDAVARETDLPIRVAQIEPNMGGRIYDALLEVAGKKLIVETKKWAPQANLGALIAQIQTMPGPGVLIADYVNPNMADELKRRGVQFMDTFGNAYLTGRGLHVWVKGNRGGAANLPAKPKRGRAFSNTGLKVVFAFLCEPELVDAPYRDIAEVADVAVGTVGWVLNDLRATGYVRQRGERAHRRLVNGQQLLERWVEIYPERLKPKQKIGDFAANEAGWWKRADIEKFHAYWGGEIAGAKLTDYLRPQVATIYVDEAGVAELLRAFRFRKAHPEGREENRVEVYRPFWRDTGPYTGVVHPVLAYADLVATADPRNIEAAQMIWETHLDRYLGQN